ncbi:MAG: hypothetical protein R3250_17610, partial [Melioribacteraceae bacterium]|nr:hypothetical protein [Melioribacteraceae bacterium]
ENIIDPPEGEEQILAWEFDDPEIAGIWQHEGEEGGFEIHLEGLSEGETHVEFFIMHEGHADYRSGKIPVRIEHSSGETNGEPIGLELIDEESGNSLLTITNNEVDGQLLVNTNEISDHMEVEFFDDNDITFQLDVPEHSLLVESADESILNITGLYENEPWAFKIQGVSAGTTSITLKILHDGSVEKEFPSITVIVN